MIIKITPFDTLFFRTGRPYTKGEDTWAEVLFPPYPSTLYGAIRSLMIFEREGLKAFNEGNYSKDIGTPDKEGGLTLKGPFLFKDNELYLKAPLDLIEEKNGKRNELALLQLEEKSEIFISDYLPNYLLIHKPLENVVEPSGWLSAIEFEDYLKNKNDKYSQVEDNNLFLYEPKIGIARQKETLTTKEGHLYRIPLLRLKEDVSLVAEVDGIDDMPETGILQLGGESKGAKYEVTEDLLIDLRNMEFNFENNLFKVYLATPAVFEKGWLPEWVDENSLEGKYNGIKLKLVACAVGHYIHIGGWNLVKAKPKPLLKSVPPGSVYYFEIQDDNDKSKIKEAFHLKNLSDINSKEGFGLSVLGEVKL